MWTSVPPVHFVENFITHMDMPQTKYIVQFTQGMAKELLIWLSTQESASTSTKQDIIIPETTQENLQNSQF